MITECLFGYEICAAATIGRRFTIHHGYAVVINRTCRRRRRILPFATASPLAPRRDSPACPADVVTALSWGECRPQLGDITIGNHVTIGAGSVVLDSIPTMRWWWEKSTGEGQHYEYSAI